MSPQNGGFIRAKLTRPRIFCYKNKILWCWSRDKQVWCYSEITYTCSSQTVTGDGNAVYYFLFANEGKSTITSRAAFPNLLRIHPESTPFCFWIEMTGYIHHISKNILKIALFSKYIILSYKYLSYGIKSFWALHFTFNIVQRNVKSCFAFLLFRLPIWRRPFLQRRLVHLSKRETLTILLVTLEKASFLVRGIFRPKLKISYIR